jgi:hypothetical protein
MRPAGLSIFAQSHNALKVLSYKAAWCVPGSLFHAVLILNEPAFFRFLVAMRSFLIFS